MVLLRKRKRTAKRSKLATVASVKKMLNGVLEKKQKSVAPTVTTMVANSIYSYNLTAQILQGTTDGARVGDSIHLKNYVANVKYVTHSAAAFYQLRVLVLWSGEEFNASTSLFTTTGLGATQVLLPGSSGFATALINPKAVTVLYDNLIEINSAINAYEDGQTIRFNIKLDQKFMYQEGASVQGKTKNLYIVIIPDWLSTNASPPANSGLCSANGVLYYTDA